jgi:hypothetical protein
MVKFLVLAMAVSLSASSAFAMGKAAPAVSLDSFNGSYSLDAGSDQSMCADPLTITVDSQAQTVTISPDMLDLHDGAMVLGAQYCVNDLADTFVQDCDSVSAGGNSLIRVYQQEGGLGYLPPSTLESMVTESYMETSPGHLKMITKDNQYCYYSRQ